MRYTEVHETDACGIRLFGLGMVPGLNNGLAVLAKAPLRLRKLKGLKLSGGIGGCGNFFGLQLSELRYALIAEVKHPATGNTVLAISLHLHSRIERTSHFLGRVADAEAERTVRREGVQDCVAALKQDQNRRLDEIRVLVNEIARLLTEERYRGAVVGGDFTVEPDSAEYRELRRAGLKDTNTISSRSGNEYSYDPVRNPLAGQEQDIALPSPLRRAIVGLSREAQQRIVDDYRNALGQTRRIDYLFHMGKPPNQLQECLRQTLFGEPMAVSVQRGSDHYGVLNTYIFDASQC